MTNPAAQLEHALRLHRAGQLAPAAALYREILRAHPNHADAHNLLGLLLRQQGDPARALEHFDRALAATPRAAPLHANRAAALRALSRHAEAAAALRAALVLDATDPAAHLNLAATHLDLDQPAEALAPLRAALALRPDHPEAHNLHGVALLAAGRATEAAAALAEALRLRPGYPAAHDNLGRALRAQGRAAEALAHYRAALAAQPRPGTHSNLLYALHFVPGLPPAEIFAEHLRWAQLHAAPHRAAQRPHPNPRDPARRLRIGYVSPDLVHHAVAYFIEPVLAAHDRAHFEVFCYSHTTAPDHVTARLRTLADGWRDISRLDDAQADALIREDRIDLLIDLAGHTAHHRLALFARRPAPVQLTWLGYPGTTGLAEIDHRLTDAISDPPGATDNFYSEKLLRLPGPFSCYRPPDEAPPVAPLPALKTGRITFGSFNHFSKVNPAVLACWATLLARVPGSRLHLKAHGLADTGTRDHVVAAFAAQGVTADRLDLRSDRLSVAAHLACYADMDIALDTFPYNGTTTTCEALWQGVPVIALAGNAHASRVSASLLTHLGRPEWIASSENDYIARAAALAADVPRLAELRRAQREPMRQSPLCDADHFTASLETALRAAWQTWCAAR